MKIIDIFKNSNEEKFIKKLSEYDSDKFQNSAPYKKFERMRQSWGEPDPNKNGPSNIYYKILKNDEGVTQDEIETITKDAKNKGVYATKEFNIYLDYLNQLKGNRSDKNNDVDKYKTQFNTFVNFGKEFINGFKSYKSALEFVLKNNWIVTKKEQEEICDIITKIQLKLSNIGGSLEELKKILSKDNFESEKGKTYYLKLAQEVQDFMYGKDNFYQKGAQKFFSKHMNVCELSLKCDKKKLENYLKKLDSDEKNRVTIIYGMLMGFLVEAYGEDNKYMKKYEELEKAFM
ncbi:MAG: hypothetical protein IJI84_04800 [Clostridia bacterium]|nr:hypothetical protein [Clostridia bacterium]